MMRYVRAFTFLIAVLAGIVGCAGGGGGGSGASPTDLVAFVSDRDGDPDIWLLSGTRGFPIQLTTDPASDIDPDFSNDGTKIAFESDRFGGSDIFQMNVDGSSQTQITFVGTATSPCYHPVGNKIVYAANPQNDVEIYELIIGGGPPIQLTDNDFIEDGHPCYSPDGSKIAFFSDRDGNPEIYIMDANGANQTRLTVRPGAQDLSPSFSPDGTKIVFVSFQFPDIGIWIMNVDGSNLAPLLVEQFDAGYPAFSTDGSRILFSSRRTGDDEIWSMNMAGGDLRNLTADVATDFMPSVGPGQP